MKKQISVPGNSNVEVQKKKQKRRKKNVDTESSLYNRNLIKNCSGQGRQV